MNRYKLTISGMTSEHCMSAVEKALSNIQGVTSVSVTLKDGMAIVSAMTGEKESTAEEAFLDALGKAVADIGYDVEQIQEWD